MAAFEPRVDSSELTKILVAFERKNRDLSPAMRVVAEDFVTAVSDRYDNGGDGEWPPLAESTLRARRKHGAGAQILMDTGRAAASTHSDFGPDFAEAATEVGYMVFHTSEEARTVIPYRNPFDLRDDVFDEAVETILEHIELP